ncbi:MAG: diguanylate cyclase response regulator [Phycisphaerae bacterium]|nr:MAG: diguanylate cyclase response regulator [Phycisphaerae bacterium]
MDVHRLLTIKLRNEGVALQHAHDGVQGLDMARTAPPAAILLDLDMPGLDGLAVIRRLKEEEATQHIPVLVLSGLRKPEDKVAAFELGAADYITKPFDLTELRVRLRAALKIHHLLQLLAHRAQIDGLTDLWNRAFFDQRWDQEHARCQRHGHPLSVAMIDIDHFKQINDTKGHPVGDAVLTGLAKVLRRESRQSDCVCRYGGEEFVLVMPDTGPTDAANVCERIRAAVESATFVGTEGLRVTISVGVAGASGACPLSPGDWLREADRNLYAAKSGGRNRVVSSDLPTVCPISMKLAG